MAEPCFSLGLCDATSGPSPDVCELLTCEILLILGSTLKLPYLLLNLLPFCIVHYGAVGNSTPHVDSITTRQHVRLYNYWHIVTGGPVRNSLKTRAAS